MRLVRKRTGLSPDQQAIAIEEEKIRMRSYDNYLQRLFLYMSCGRNDVHQAVLTSVSFFALPEFFSR